MKNNNKFLVKSAKRTANTFIITLIVFTLFPSNSSVVYAKTVQQVKQVTNEESVFDTNSIDTNVIEGVKIEKFQYCNTSIDGNQDDLVNNINQEITNRIDVCKANTEVSDVTSSIEDVKANLMESKAQKDEEAAKAAAEEAERNYCLAASENVPNYIAGCRSNVKTYMPYTAVTSKGSDQYKLLNSSSAYTDPDTGLRMFDGRYCIAVGTGYCGKIGTKIDLVMANGNIVKCILGDVKADCDTDPTNRFHATDGSVAEFIVDYSVFNSKKDSSGSVNWVDGLDGAITKVVILND